MDISMSMCFWRLRSGGVSAEMCREGDNVPMHIELATGSFHTAGAILSEISVSGERITYTEVCSAETANPDYVENDLVQTRCSSIAERPRCRG